MVGSVLVGPWWTASQLLRGGVSGVPKRVSAEGASSAAKSRRPEAAGTDAWRRTVATVGIPGGAAGQSGESRVVSKRGVSGGELSELRGVSVTTLPFSGPQAAWSREVGARGR